MIFALLALLACDPLEGTAVGNPGGSRYDDGELTVALTDVPDSLTVTQATMDLSALALDGCTDAGERIDVSAEIDLLDPTAVAVPGGEWCALVVEVATNGLSLSGETSDATRFSVILDPGDLVISHAVTIDGGAAAVTLSLDRFVDASALDDPSGEVEITPADPLGEEWADAVADATSLGGSSADAVAAYTDSEAGCTCGHGGTDSGAGGAWWVLLSAGAYVARRRPRTGKSHGRAGSSDARAAVNI